MGETEAIIGAFEAKTRLSELLREAARGASFVIERRGRKVARLVPYAEETEDGRAAAARILDALGEVRSRTPGEVDVVALVAEGRR